MRAVNLLPPEQRHAGEATFRGSSPATLGLFGVLALALVVVAAYVLLANDVSSRKQQLARVNAQAAAVQRQADALKPYANVLTWRTQTLSQLRSLAGARYDWPTKLAQVARALPSDVTLTTLDGELGSGSAAAPGATATGTGPTIALNGCTPSHSAVAGAMDRLNQLDGVLNVQLSSSTKGGGSAGAAATGGASGAGGCTGDDQFQLTVDLKPLAGATAGAATAPTTPATTSSPTTTPSTTTTPTTSTTPATTTTPAPATSSAGTATTPSGATASSTSTAPSGGS